MVEFTVSTHTSLQTLARLGSRFKEYRLALNVTQNQLAARTGITRSVIIRFEAGKNVTTDTFVRLLSGLGLQSNLMLLIPDASIRPMDRVENMGNERVRARQKKQKPSTGNWKWGDEK
ncbi:MAG: helix-turn-helix transcriptional regulator [Anaerolineaceae bacterium]